MHDPANVTPTNLLDTDLPSTSDTRGHVFVLPPLSSWSFVSAQIANQVARCAAAGRPNPGSSGSARARRRCCPRVAPWTDAESGGREKMNEWTRFKLQLAICNLQGRQCCRQPGWRLSLRATSGTRPDAARRRTPARSKEAPQVTATEFLLTQTSKSAKIDRRLLYLTVQLSNHW